MAVDLSPGEPVKTATAGFADAEKPREIKKKSACLIIAPTLITLSHLRSVHDLSTLGAQHDQSVSIWPHEKRHASRDASLYPKD